jgi:hypothetical protein
VHLIPFALQKANSIKDDAGNMEKRFVELKDQFSKFVGSFSTWAKSREEADTQEIKDIYTHIAELDVHIANINTAMLILAGALAVTLPITGVLALCFAPVAPFIIVCYHYSCLFSVILKVNSRRELGVSSPASSSPH